MVLGSGFSGVDELGLQLADDGGVFTVSCHNDAQLFGELQGLISFGVRNSKCALHRPGRNLQTS